MAAAAAWPLVWPLLDERTLDESAQFVCAAWAEALTDELWRRRFRRLARRLGPAAGPRPVASVCREPAGEPHAPATRRRRWARVCREHAAWLRPDERLRRCSGAARAWGAGAEAGFEYVRVVDERSGVTLAVSEARGEAVLFRPTASGVLQTLRLHEGGFAAFGSAGPLLLLARPRAAAREGDREDRTTELLAWAPLATLAAAGRPARSALRLGGRAPVTALHVAADAQFAALATGDGAVHVCDLARGGREATLRYSVPVRVLHTSTLVPPPLREPPRVAALRSNRAKLVVASERGLLRILEMRSGAVKARLGLHGRLAHVQCLGTSVWAAGPGEALRVLNSRRARWLRPDAAVCAGAPSCVALLPEAALVGFAGGGIQAWDARGDERREAFAAPPVAHIAADSTKIVAVTAAGEALIFGWGFRAPLVTLAFATFRRADVRGDVIALGAEESGVVVLRVSSGSPPASAGASA